MVVEATDYSARESNLLRFGHLPRTRKDAEAVGAKMFYLDEPCLSGHYAPRYTIGRACVACHQERAALRTVARRKAKEDAEQQKRQAEINGALDRLASLADGKNGVDAALASFLMMVGGRAIVPGVVYIESWPTAPEFTKALVAAKRRALVQVSENSGLLCAPRVIVANLPGDAYDAKFWREALGGVDDCVMLAGIRSLVTTVLDQRRRAPEAPHKVRAAFDAWVGNEQHGDSLPEGAITPNYSKELVASEGGA